VENTSELSTKEMSLFTGEFRVRFNFSVQVTGEDVLNLHSVSDMLRSAVGKLNPIIKEIISDPVNELVNTSTTSFNILRENFTLIVKASTEYPVILFSTVDFTYKTDLIGSAHDAQTFDRVLKLIGVFFTETNVSPFEHLGFFSEVR